MDIGAMKQILLEEMQEYTGKGLNDYAYLTSNETNQIYTVVDIATIRDKRIFTHFFNQLRNRFTGEVLYTLNAD